ncbi:PD-(D/E)XK endonuclease-like domain-containing protein [Desulfonema limicola]|uniref:PD-(D/E)XK endonuclease-like domain-containing protein n=1 Tax=Desulfonema limicola TaxID=45656 RepID=A0A975GIR6_9BACT|nr:PD-(D/E)XK nuclease family protein [Desulfonema limicola]QTA82721.1 PD-(D/E)XK endonuclease-like domain-containing protein [Desulfonema limicola]
MTNIQLQTLAQLKENLHISYSQISCYMNCPLKYMFRYVKGFPPERVSSALIFGKSIHTGIEHFYITYKRKQEKADVNTVQELFADVFSSEINKAEAPVVFRRDENKDTSISMGKAMLKAFCKSAKLKDTEIIGVEMPLSARLYTDTGKFTDFLIIGVIDALIKNCDGDIVAIDNKTALRAKSSEDVEKDLQFSVYGYLLCANKYVAKTEDAYCRMDVLRKLKNPKVEKYGTIRTPSDRKRLAKIAVNVLTAIENQAFYPVRSWMCSGGCEYKDACYSW